MNRRPGRRSSVSPGAPSRGGRRRGSSATWARSGSSRRIPPPRSGDVPEIVRVVEALARTGRVREGDLWIALDLANGCSGRTSRWTGSRPPRGRRARPPGPPSGGSRGRVRGLEVTGPPASLVEEPLGPGDPGRASSRAGYGPSDRRTAGGRARRRPGPDLSGSSRGERIALALDQRPFATVRPHRVRPSGSGQDVEVDGEPHPAAHRSQAVESGGLRWYLFSTPYRVRSSGTCTGRGGGPGGPGTLPPPRSLARPRGGGCRARRWFAP